MLGLLARVIIGAVVAGAAGDDARAQRPQPQQQNTN